jgi:hypothetical protein
MPVFFNGAGYAVFLFGAPRVGGPGGVGWKCCIRSVVQLIAVKVVPSLEAKNEDFRREELKTHTSRSLRCKLYEGAAGNSFRAKIGYEFIYVGTHFRFREIPNILFVAVCHAAWIYLAGRKLEKLM